MKIFWVRTSFGCLEKKPPANRRAVTARTELHSMITFHHAWLQWKKQYGSIWCMISPVLTADDAVMSRDSDKPLNSGEPRDFFMMLQSDPDEKDWHFVSDGNRMCTMLPRLRSGSMSPDFGDTRRHGCPKVWTGTLKWK